MNPVIFRTVNRQKVYLSTTGKWIKSKANARVFSSVAEAQTEAAKHGAAVGFYTFRSF